MARKNDILSIYAKEVEEIREAGLFKGEAPIASAQGARVNWRMAGRSSTCAPTTILAWATARD